jgi:hypothetical protein
MFGLEAGVFILLIFCFLAACAFEFVNGFNDTANAVATVSYTHSLKPTHAFKLNIPSQKKSQVWTWFNCKYRWPLACVSRIRD